MCECASESVECQTPLPVSALCCDTDRSCCTPSLTLGGLSDEIKSAWDADYDRDDRTAAEEAVTALGASAATVDLLGAYADAIELSAERLAQKVCMARYAADCQLCATICVPEPCGCNCCYDDCDTCRRRHVRIDQIGDCVTPSRVASVALGDGTAVGFNGSDPTAALQIRATGRGWKLFGATVEHGGRITVCFQLKPAPAAWKAAVLSFACRRVRCGHASGCTRDEYTVSETNDGISRTFITLADQVQLGLLGDKFADDLNRECVGAARYRFGGRPNVVELIQWVGGSTGTGAAPFLDLEVVGDQLVLTGDPTPVDLADLHEPHFSTFGTEL